MSLNDTTKTFSQRTKYESHPNTAESLVASRDKDARVEDGINIYLTLEWTSLKLTWKHFEAFNKISRKENF